MSMLSDGGDTTNAKVPIEGDLTSFPCTLLQRKFFEIQQARPDATVGNVAMRWQLKGPLRDSAIEFALQALIDRHEILRTRFALLEGVAVQVVETVRIRPSFIDVSRLPVHIAEQEIARISGLTAKIVFDLGIAPLLRCNVIRISTTEAILLLTFHSTIIDGWSIGVLARELVQLLASSESGKAAKLPEIELQYADYALWQQELLGIGAYEEELAFWRARLDGLPGFEIPRSARTPAAQASGQSRIVSILLDSALTNTIDALSRREGQIRFSVTGACLVSVLARAARSDEVVIGAQVAGRDDVLLEELVGPVFNSVILRFPNARDDNAMRHLRACGKIVTQAFAHHSVPLEAVADACGLATAPGKFAPYSINFTVQAANLDTGRADTLRVAGIELASIPSVSSGSLYDLNFFMVQRPEGWRISCEFDESAYDSAMVEALLADWQSEMVQVGQEKPHSSSISAGMTVADTLIPSRNSASNFRTFAMQPKGHLPAIFAFNNQSVYYPIARGFGQTRPFVDIQWHGRGGVTPLGNGSISELASDAAHQVIDYDPTGPYYFIGHCLVGIIALETARQLRLTGREVHEVFLLDTLAPGYVEGMPRRDRIIRRFQLWDFTYYYSRIMLGKVKNREISIFKAVTALYHFAVHGYMDRAFTEQADFLDTDIMVYLQKAKATFNSASYDGDVTVFRSASAKIGRLFDRGFGWGRLVTGQFRVYDVPGGHMEMTREPAASVIAEHMQWSMDRHEGRWSMSKAS